MPLAEASCDAAWSLGVLCSTPDQLALLAELRPTVRRGGRIGLLVFVAHRELPGDQLEGSHFPTLGRLRQLVDESALHVEHWLRTAELPAIPAEWNERLDAVTDELNRRHRRAEAWQLAERQSARIGRLLEEGTLTGELLVLRHA